MEYTIYLRTNLVNGKQYVGQTSNFPKRENEWKCLSAYYANKKLNEDREKYGLDNWKVEILAETDNRKDAWELEKRFINDYNTVFPNGYNRAFGGETNKGGNIGYHNGKEFEKGHKPWNYDLKNTHFSPDTEFKPISVVQLKNSNVVKIWDSIKDAAESVDNCYTSSISRCCKGITKSAGGFNWMYKEDYDKIQ